MTETKEKTKREKLEDKVWFRALKVLYIIIYSLAILAISIIVISDVFNFNFFLVFIPATVLVMWLIKKAFYYIVLGKNNVK